MNYPNLLNIFSQYFIPIRYDVRNEETIFERKRQYILNFADE